MSSKYNMDCYLNPVPIRRLETVDRKLQRLRKLHVHFEDLQTAYTKTYKYGNSRGIIESQLKDAPHTSSSSKLLEVPTIINFFRDTKEVNVMLLFVALLSDLCWWRFLMTTNEMMVCESTSSVAHYCFSDSACSLLTFNSFRKIRIDFVVGEQHGIEKIKFWEENQTIWCGSCSGFNSGSRS